MHPYWTTQSSFLTQEWVSGPKDKQLSKKGLGGAMAILREGRVCLQLAGAHIDSITDPR